MGIILPAIPLVSLGLKRHLDAYHLTQKMQRLHFQSPNDVEELNRLERERALLLLTFSVFFAVSIVFVPVLIVILIVRIKKANKKSEPKMTCERS